MLRRLIAGAAMGALMFSGAGCELGQPRRTPPRAEPGTLDAWLQLQQGMTREEVRALLGDPIQVENKDFERWLYPGRAEVKFRADKLAVWQSPRFEEGEGG
ncbi:MAG: outer membrane protein assembly factor BamE [Phycisphaerales bacterium]|nr:outer membrane protein assembly factor BamE [Phycisphaerales bacterium]